MSSDVNKRPRLGPLAGAAIVCPNPEQLAGIYTANLHYRVEQRGIVGGGLEDAWGAPAQVGAAFVLLRPSSGAAQWIRLVAGPARDWAPSRTFGWSALELVVADVDQLKRDLEGSPFKRLSGPHFLSGGKSTIRAMQMEGPAGEVLYLTQVPDEPDKDHLPKAKSAVDRLFIAVLGVPDAPVAQDWYCGHFAVEPRPHRTALIRCLNQSFELPEDYEHPLASVRLSGQGMIEINGYPETATARTAREGFLPAGIATVSIYVESIDERSLPLLRAPVTLTEPPYEGARVAVARGPAGERIELLEGVGPAS